jgi:hypothetical protein
MRHFANYVCIRFWWWNFNTPNAIAHWFPNPNRGSALASVYIAAAPATTVPIFILTCPRSKVQSLPCVLTLDAKYFAKIFRFPVTSNLCPCLVSPILPQIPLCKKKISRHIKMSANAWSTKC